MSTNENLEEKTMGIFLNIFPEINESSFDWDKVQNDYENWDSFAHLRIVTEIEEKFGISLEMDDFVYIQNAAGFLKIIKENITRK